MTVLKILRTCEHMIHGQLTMGARQAKNAPLIIQYKNCDVVVLPPDHMADSASSKKLCGKIRWHLSPYDEAGMPRYTQDQGCKMAMQLYNGLTEGIDKFGKYRVQ